MRYESNLNRGQVESILANKELGKLIQKTQDLLGDKFKQGLKFKPDQEREYNKAIKAIKENNFYRKYWANHFREQ